MNRANCTDINTLVVGITYEGVAFLLTSVYYSSGEILIRQNT